MACTWRIHRKATYTGWWTKIVLEYVNFRMKVHIIVYEVTIFQGASRFGSDYWKRIIKEELPSHSDSYKWLQLCLYIDNMSIICDY